MANPESVRSRSVHHVAYATRDPEATYAFYAKKLGMTLLRTENHRQGEGFFRHFFFDMGGGEALAFFEVHGVGEKPEFSTEISHGLGLPVWVNHIAFRLDSLEELEAMTKRMHARGIDDIVQIDHGWATFTTDAESFAQSEEEALRLMRQPPDEIPEPTRKETSVARRV
jgi:catechol 2,3-dioxygenase-like lactoylglutathione lyase family enzyme